MERRSLRAIQEHGVEYAGGIINVSNPTRHLIDAGTATVTATKEWTGSFTLMGASSLKLLTRENLGTNVLPSMKYIVTLYSDDTLITTITGVATTAGANSATVTVIDSPLIRAATRCTYVISGTYAAVYRLFAYWYPDAEQRMAVTGALTVTTGSMHVSGTCQICGQCTISGNVGINNWSDMPSTPGGGDSIYSTMQGDFVATPTAGGKTFAIAGLPFTPEAQHIQKVILIASGCYINIPLSTAGLTITNNTATLTGNLTRNFGAGDALAVTLVGPDKAYNDAADAKRMNEINPLSQHFLPYKEATTANASTVSFYYDMNGYQHFAVQGTYTGTAVFTFRYAYTLQDDGTVASSCLYNNIATGSWVTGAVSGTFEYQRTAVIGCKYVRMQAEITASATWTHYVKTWY